MLSRAASPRRGRLTVTGFQRIAGAEKIQADMLKARSLCRNAIRLGYDKQAPNPDAGVPAEAAGPLSDVAQRAEGFDLLGR